MIRIIALIALALLSAGWLGMGGWVATPPPATANIPIASLANGSYPANNWAGFTTNATTVSTTVSRKYIQTTTNSSVNTLAIGTDVWRDQEVTFYLSKGRIILRGSQGGSGLYMSLALNSATSFRIGIITNNSYILPEGGTTAVTYIQDTPAACITNWPTDADHTFTFGVRGFEVYLLIDGVQAYDTCQKTELNPTGAIRYKEYRAQAMQAGKVSVWAHGGSVGGGVGNQITATYYPLTTLYSNYASGIFDTRDFGMRAISAVTGSMSAGSCTLTLSSARDFRVNDRIIVEIGGETGAGAYNSVGVGGTSPMLHYANSTARNADTTQPDSTYAYLDTDGSVAKWVSGVWATVPGGAAPSMPASALYYGEKKAPVSLIATVSAVNASPATTLTLTTWGANQVTNCSTAATTNANVYLDSSTSFYPMTTTPAWVFNPARADGIDAYTNMTISVPAGTWYVSGRSMTYRVLNGDRSGLTFKGAGQAVTTFVSPKGVPSLLLESNTGNNNVTIQDFSYVGNRADSGYMWNYTSDVTTAGNTNKNFPEDNPVAIIGGVAGNANTVQRIDCLNDFRGCAVLSGSNAQILNSQVVNTQPQRNYLQWEFMLVTSTTGTNKMENLTATSPWLYKSFNCFGTNPCAMINVGGTNALLAHNGGSTGSVDGFNTTITEDSFLNQQSGWLDEGVVQINDNNSYNGTTGTVTNFRIIHQGYTQVSSQRSLHSFKIQGSQTNWTISGSYSGVSGCTSALSGYIEYIGAPYSALSGSSYGAMAVYSDTNNTTVTGIRVVGSAIGSPGHSSRYGNIAIPTTGSVASGNVADVIQPGPSGTGNRTNAAFCP